MEEQDLQAFIRKPFTVYLAGAKVELELIDVRALSASAGARVKGGTRSSCCFVALRSVITRKRCHGKSTSYTLLMGGIFEVRLGSDLNNQHLC
jgi:hypothetical protein